MSVLRITTHFLSVFAQKQTRQNLKANEVEAEV